MSATDLEPSETSPIQATARAGVDPLNGALRPAGNRRQLGVLGLVLACAGATGLAYLKAGPQSASAATTTPVAPADPVGQFVAGDAAGMKRIAQALNEGSPVIEQLRSSSSMTQVPLTDLKTNPFRLHVASAQLPANDPAQRARNEQERQAALQSIQGLQLQSILRGDSHRACLINGSLFQEGQEISGFTIEEIGMSMVVVRRGIYRFELKMAK